MNDNKARLFISYSHRGNGPEWKAKLVRHLRVFEEQHLLDVWQDGKIRVSSYWHDDIEQAMSAARLAVVLLTPEALESDYIVNIEFPFLRERQQRDKLPVFPVVCEECDWEPQDWLRATQAPNESNPLSQLSAPAQERVFRQLATDIAEGLSRAALNELPKADGPPPSDHIYLDKFPLTRGGGQPEKLIGREQEVALLDLAFAQQRTAIVSLVAWGGVGKTMLVQHWLHRLQRESWFGARRIYAWNFYSQGTREDRQASEDTFLAHALEWFGIQCEPTLLPWEKGRLLADALARERTLLILDGIEPLQYPPGPMGGQLRAPGVQSLLKHLARKANNTEHHGLCLVTTREPLTDLAEFQRRPDGAWGSVLRVDLGNLTEEAGAALLHHAGARQSGAAEIKPDDVELLVSSREVDGHALTLHLLGRFLARAHGGDIRRRDLVKFEEADRTVQGGTTFRMLAAFEDWFTNEGEIEARALTVLRLLGLFDRPAEGGCLGVLRQPPAIAGVTDSLFVVKRNPIAGQPNEQPLSDKGWNDATHFLADFGLVSRYAVESNAIDTLDCHPLVREYFASNLKVSQAPAWLACHTRLYTFLCSPTEDSTSKLRQGIVHGCKANLHSKAFHLTLKVQIHRLGNDQFRGLRFSRAFSDELSALACFFEEPWNRAVPSVESDGWLFHHTGFCLRELGRMSEAIEALKCAADIELRQGDWQKVATTIDSLGRIELFRGNISDALALAEQSVAYAAAADCPNTPSFCLFSLANVLHQAGRSEDSMKCFDEAIQLSISKGDSSPLLSGLGVFFFSDCLLAPAERSALRLYVHGDNVISPSVLRGNVESCRQVHAIAGIHGIVEQDPRGTGLLHLATARSLLYEILVQRPARMQTIGALGTVRQELEAAISALKGSSDALYMPYCLETKAWLECLNDDLRSAISDLDEAWDLAERSDLRLHKVDIHLLRASLFRKVTPYPWSESQTARRRRYTDDLRDARRYVEDCGYLRHREELHWLEGPMPN